MHTPRSLLKDILNIHPFPGWTSDEIYPFIKNKISRLEFDLLFPNKTESLITEYQHYLNDLLSEVIAVHLPNDLGTTEKIRWMIRTHFEHILSHKEAEYAAITAVYQSNIALNALVYVANLTDLMWKATGTYSIDMSYYTKRISLGIIYVTTLLYWYHHPKAPIDDIMAFFDDRLNNLKETTKVIKQYNISPENLIKNIKLLKTVFFDQ